MTPNPTPLGDRNEAFDRVDSHSQLNHELSITRFPQEIPTTWEVYFSPNRGCTNAIVRKLDNALSTVLVQAYSFTSYRIAKAFPFHISDSPSSNLISIFNLP